MARQIKFHFLHSLFRLFAYLADKSGGWRVFVKPKIVLGGLIIGIGVTAAQNQPGKSLTNNTAKSSTKQGAKKTITTDNKTSDLSFDCIYEVEDYPEFPGGDVVAYIAKNLRYPDSCYKKGIQGRVICQFVVEKDGSLTDFQVVRGVHPDLDKEAVRVLSSMPKWIPGKRHHQPERMKYTMPVNFKIGKEDNTDTSVYTIAEIPPQFTDGDVNAYVAKNIRYPVISTCYVGIQGRVICQFIVEKDGSVSNVHVVRSVDPEIDKEAIRVISSMPKWIPGEQNGKKVRVRLTLPVSFKLQ